MTDQDVSLPLATGTIPVARRMNLDFFNINFKSLYTIVPHE